MKTSQGAPRHAVTAITAVIACLAIAACGSSATTTTSASSGGSGGTANAATTSTTSTTSTTPGAAGFAAERAKLQACLKAHGVTLPSRRPGGYGGYGGLGAGGVGGGTGTTGTSTTPRRTFRYGGSTKDAAAFKACGADFGGGFGGGRFGGGRFTPHFSTATLNAYVACVKKNGFTLPKPNTSGKGTIFPQSIETNKKFQAASKSCASILQSAFHPGGAAGPGGAPAGSAPPTTTTSIS